MTLPLLPGRATIQALCALWLLVLAALLFGMTVETAARLTGLATLGLSAAIAYDFFVSRRSWRRAAPKLTRRLPAAFAVGVKRPVQLAIDVEGTHDWQCEFYDHVDSSLETIGLPVRLALPAGRRLETIYTVTPTRRGEVTFAPADLRVRSRFGLCELLETLGPRAVRRVYPDFSQVARYAWLAGDRRLQEIGIKTWLLRGQGTDFKQLSEYRVGDSVRNIDWKASLRIGKPIVREFQDERDQCVMLLIDCGRRMRADDRSTGAGSSHFDQVLNAVMLLSYVALKQGDAVGAMTFGTAAGHERAYPPRKGARSLNGLMAELYGVQPAPVHSDYVAAAQSLLRRQHKRALVVLITNFRDEDSSELKQALRLLRARHRVMVASVRERIVSELTSQSLTSADAPLEVASAHLYEQSRRDAFRRLAARDALMVDAEPDRLGVELVNRYHAAKRAGVI